MVSRCTTLVSYLGLRIGPVRVAGLSPPARERKKEATVERKHQLFRSKTFQHLILHSRVSVTKAEVRADAAARSRGQWTPRRWRNERRTPCCWPRIYSFSYITHHTNSLGSIHSTYYFNISRVCTSRLYFSQQCHHFNGTEKWLFGLPRHSYVAATARGKQPAPLTVYRTVCPQSWSQGLLLRRTRRSFPSGGRSHSQLLTFAYPWRDGSSWVDLGAWFCAEVVYPSKDGHPSRH